MPASSGADLDSQDWYETTHLGDMLTLAQPPTKCQYRYPLPKIDTNDCGGGDTSTSHQRQSARQLAHELDELTREPKKKLMMFPQHSPLEQMSPVFDQHLMDAVVPDSRPSITFLNSMHLASDFRLTPNVDNTQNFSGSVLAQKVIIPSLVTVETPELLPGKTCDMQALEDELCSAQRRASSSSMDSTPTHSSMDTTPTQNHKVSTVPTLTNPPPIAPRTG